MANYSIRELARRIGVSDTAINKARADGRIPADLFGTKPSGRPYVLDMGRAMTIAAQAFSLDLVTDPGKMIQAAEEPAPKPPKRQVRQKPAESAPVEQLAPEPEPDEDIDLEQVDEMSRDGLMRIKAAREKSRAKREQYEAEMARMERDQMAGRTLDKDELTRALFLAGRKCRDSIELLPTRLAPQLAGETDQHVITMMLTSELKRTLEELARDLQRAVGTH